MGLIILPTTIKVGNGTRFMLYGDRDKVFGLTDRLLFSGTRGTYRLILADGFRGTLTNGFRQEHHVSLANGGEDVTVESSSHAATFERLFMGGWRLTVRDPQSGPIWTMDEVHAGVAACRSCLQPTPIASFGQEAVSCENPRCKSSPVKQLTWTDLPNLFNMKDGSPKPNLVEIDSWRAVLNTRRSSD